MMDDTPGNAWSRGPFRVEFRCTLEFTGPLHVGTGEALSLATDAPVLRDAAGRVWLPGSSVRGVLADWCHREAALLGIDRAYVRRLFGVTPQRGGGSSKKDENDRQGRLTVLDIELCEGSEQIRDHVRIERAWGAAARGGKFDHEIAHRSARSLTLIYEGDSQEDPELVLLQSAADALQEGLLAFGGKTGWGLGAARVGTDKNSSGRPWTLVNRKESVELSTFLGARLPAGGTGRGAGAAAAERSVTDARAMSAEKRARVAKRLPERKPRKRNASEPSPWSWLRLHLRLAFDGPMLVAALDPTVGPNDTSSFARERREADATYQVDSAGRPVLPGSALRGLLRSDAERIDQTLGLEGLAKILFGSVRAQGLVRVEEGVLEGDANPVLLNHVSIDRVTGFAATHRLFNVAALSSPCFRSELLVRWDADKERHRQAVALLCFVLRDAEQQGLWIGSRTTRGYGHAKAVEIEAANWSLVVNGHPPPAGAGPTRRKGRNEAPTTVAELADCLGFVQKDWADAFPQAETDAKTDASPPSAAEGARGDGAD